MTLTSVGFHHMTCGCLLDEGYGLKVCPMHLMAPKLLDAARLSLLPCREADPLSFLRAVVERIDALAADGC